MTNGQVDGLEADLEFSWNQRFDKVSKSILLMNAIFMPVIALVSGRVWQSHAAADQELIRRIVKGTARHVRSMNWPTNEPKLVEQFKATGVPVAQCQSRLMRLR